MKNLSQHIIYTGIFFLGVLCCNSCKKFVEVPDAKNKLPNSAVFADSLDATSAVLGLYINTMNYTSPILLNGAVTINAGLAADELVPTINDYIPDDLQFYANGVSAIDNGSNTGSCWQSAYINIYRANACIEGITASGKLSSTLKNQLLGEAKLFRALNYFHLVNFYGPVPLVTTTQYTVNASLPRASVDNIYQQIEADLVSAQGTLNLNYPSQGRVRPNRLTASAFLSKVYLYQKKWSDAEITASKVIGAGIYSLETDLNGVFLPGSNEAIWQMPPLNSYGYETNEGVAFIPDPSVPTIPAYVISPYLLKVFEVGDKRQSNWISTVAVNNATYSFPFKYKLGYDGNTTPSESYMIFRLGEQYLIRAEALAQQGKLSEATADLNKIRNRAGLANATAALQEDLLKAISHERQTELFCEWGNRWYDLKRTGQVDPVMSVVTPAKGGAWNGNWALFPVPYSEMQLNPFLTQNPGY